MSESCKSVVPSRVTIVPASDYVGHGGQNVQIEFQCPNCASMHSMIEHVVCNFIDFNNPGWQLPCGWVEVLLPWPLATADQSALAIADYLEEAL